MNFAHHLQGGKFFPQIEAQGNIGFVVTQIDIVTGPMALDQGIFKNQRLFLRIGDNRLV